MNITGCDVITKEMFFRRVLKETALIFVKLEELHIVTARKPLIHQSQPAISAQNSAMHVVVYAGRLTSQRSIVEIINW